MASVFGAHTAVALAGAQWEVRLEAKAASGDVIGMAKRMITAKQASTTTRPSTSSGERRNE